jgi:hypothetical protein
MKKEKGIQAIEAYPDGWTCISCGDEYTEETIDAKDFYVIHSEHGTECKQLTKENENEIFSNGFRPCRKASVC